MSAEVALKELIERSEEIAAGAAELQENAEKLADEARFLLAQAGPRFGVDLKEVGLAEPKEPPPHRQGNAFLRFFLYGSLAVLLLFTFLAGAAE